MFQKLSCTGTTAWNVAARVLGVLSGCRDRQAEYERLLGQEAANGAAGLHKELAQEPFRFRSEKCGRQKWLPFNEIGKAVGRLGPATASSLPGWPPRRKFGRHRPGEREPRPSAWPLKSPGCAAFDPAPAATARRSWQSMTLGSAALLRAGIHVLRQHVAAQSRMVDPHFWDTRLILLGKEP